MAGLTCIEAQPVDLHNTRRSATKVTNHKAPGYPFDDVENLINEQPSGQETWFSRDAVKWMHLISALESGVENDVPTMMVEGEDNMVYFRNFFMDFESMGWIKGKKEKDNTIALDFPQIVYDEEYGKQHYYYYAAVLQLNEEGTDYILSDTQHIQLDVDDNGNIIQDNPELMIGLCYLYDDDIKDQATTNGNENCYMTWFGIGYTNMEWKKINAFITELPTGIYAEQYAMACGDNSQFVNIAIDGNQIYVNGLADNDKACFVGTIHEDGKSVTFTSPQYVGMDSDNEFFNYFVAAATQYDVDAEAFVVSSTDKFTMNIDTESKTLTYKDKGTGFAISNGKESVGGGSLFLEPTFTPQTEYVFDLPEAPIFVNYNPYNDNVGYGVLNFDLPCYNANKMLINAENIYYTIYFDDKPATFSPDYYWNLTEDMTEIPYSFTDYYDFFSVGINHAVYLYEGGYNKIGVKVIVRDGEELQSKIYYYDDINTQANAKVYNQTVSTIYYDLSGRIICNPQNGIFIKQTKMSDGSVKNEKIIRK